MFRKAEPDLEIVRRDREDRPGAPLSTVLSLSTCFLMGPFKQLKKMFETTRLLATIIMLVSSARRRLCGRTVALLSHLPRPSFRQSSVPFLLLRVMVTEAGWVMQCHPQDRPNVAAPGKGGRAAACHGPATRVLGGLLWALLDGGLAVVRWPVPWRCPSVAG